MEVIDFFPKYPDIHSSKYDALNPYSEDFYEALFHKKEFYENRLDRVEIFPKERGLLTKYQQTIVRYMSSHTPYNRLLLVHAPGLGKTCSAVGAVEQIKSEGSTFDGALILAKGEGILDNWTNEIVEKCTAGYYIPEKYSKLTELEKIHRVKKKTKFYQMRTFAKFAKKIQRMSDPDVEDTYSNKIIVIDEVHNLRPQPDQKGTLEIYQQFHRFLHLVKNCKVLCLSGTPMKDSPQEIASVANLLLPLDNQLPAEEEFIQDYMIESKGVYKIRPEKVKDLKNRLKGLISFLREPEPTVRKQFIGKERYGKLKHFVVNPLQMSKFQTKGFSKALSSDKEGMKGVYINSREASLFVYPDGSYGREGFQKYINEVKTKKMVKGKEVSVSSHYRMSQELANAVTGANREDTLARIARHSATYAEVIRNVLDAKGNCFVYSSLTQGSGCILFSLLLELFGFAKAKGREKEPALRYAILTNKTASSQELKRITSRFNKKDNMKGDMIKVIIGSKAVSEGFTFKNVIFEAINTPHWNYSEIAQALARGIRLGSHNDLLASGETPIVDIMQPVSIPADGSMSMDLYLYQISEDKDISIRSIIRVLMENAFDCALNYIRNYVDGKDNSRECDYAKCKYTCDGMDMAEVENGLDEKELDYSTYQLYYANPKTPLIRKKIERLFRENYTIDLDSIVKNLEKEFTEEEIQNALYVIKEETEGTEFDYRKFLEIYSRSPVKKVANAIEVMFRHSFVLSFETIKNNLSNQSEFEILSAVRNLINENVPIVNRYGISCYLREDRDLYFLVDSMSDPSQFYTEYYTKSPYLHTQTDISDILGSVYSSSLPKIVDRLCSAVDEKEFSRLVKSLPPKVQEYIIEAALVAKKLKVGDGVRDRVLKFFEGYIRKVGKTWVSSFLKGEGVLRCGEPAKGLAGWKDCPEDFKAVFHEKEMEKEQKIREDNPYGIIGKHNPENDAFCLVDVSKEKESKEKVAAKRERGVSDKRVTYSGKVCGAGGWKLKELIAIAANRLKIDPPEDFRATDSLKTLLKKAQSEASISNLIPDNPEKDDLRRLLYWGSAKRDGGVKGIKPICQAIREWLQNHDMLDVDNQCGVQGKRKLGSKSEATKESSGPRKTFRIVIFEPSKDEATFKANIKEVAKLMGECFGVEKYKPDDKDKGYVWVTVFSRKKLVGFVSLGTDGIIHNVCVAKNYRRQGISKQAMGMIDTYVTEKYGKQPVLILDNRIKNSKGILRMYGGFGFEVFKSDERNSYLRYKSSE